MIERRWGQRSERTFQALSREQICPANEFAFGFVRTSDSLRFTRSRCFHQPSPRPSPPVADMDNRLTFPANADQNQEPKISRRLRLRHTAA